MCIPARIFQRGLVVVGSFRQTWRPCIVSIRERGFAFRNFAIAIAIDEEVGVAVIVINDCRPTYLCGIGLHRRIQNRAHIFDLEVDAFAHVAVTIIVNQGTGHTDVYQVFRSTQIGVASGTFVKLNFQRMRIMAAYAGIVPFHVIKLGIVRLPFIFIATHGPRTKLRGRSRVVMDVGEAQVCTYGIQICCGIKSSIDDGIVYSDRGCTSLMTLHTTRFRA